MLPVVIAIGSAPVITSYGGGETAVVSQPEHTYAAATVTAADSDSAVLSYSIVGGPDAAAASMTTVQTPDGWIGLFALVNPDFEDPARAGDNRYEVIVRVTDELGLYDDQTITVNVTDRNDTPVITSYNGRAEKSP